MSDMDRLLAARFFVEEGDGFRTVDVRVGADGKLVANAVNREKIVRFEIYRADGPSADGKPLFWTQCCASGSRFSIDARTLTVEYVVRNALVDDINHGSTVDKIGPLLFRLRAEVGEDRRLLVKSLKFGKFPRDAVTEYLYEIWVENKPQDDFRWPVGADIGRSRLVLFAGMGLNSVQLAGKSGFKVPFAVRKVKKSGEERYRTEFRLDVNNATNVATVWPVSAVAGAAEPFTGKRLRLPQKKGMDALVEYGISLEYDPGSHATAYQLVQTDPWQPPTDGDVDVWREFHIRDLPAQRILAGFNRCVSDPIRSSVGVSNEADNISLLPRLEAVQQGGETARANIVWHQQDLRPNQVEWSGAADFGRARDVGIETVGGLEVDVVLPGLVSDDGPIAFRANCVFAAPIDAQRSSAGACSAITLSGAKAFEPHKIDVGALRLDFSAAALNSFALSWGLAADQYRPAMQRPLLRLECGFSGIGAQPSGFDPDPISRYSDDDNSDLLRMPILHDVDQRTIVKSVFNATERLRDDRSRSLSLSLAAQAPAGGGGATQDRPQAFELIVLDQNPFFVGKIAFQLPKANNADSNGYASWSLSDPEGPRWRFRSLQPEATLTLPTQGVGEAYERRKDIDDPARGIGYRLGPHAVFHLRLRDDERAYSDLPWNLRLLFGRPGEPAAGPLLSLARFELLYGLESTLRPSGVRLTTDEIQRGRIAQRFGGSDPAKNTFDASTLPVEYRTAWNALVESYQNRLLSLQPYRPFEAGSPRFDQDSGLRQRLRLAKTGADAADRRENADLHAMPYLEKGAAGSDSGLRGGATFGFESKRIYDAVTRDLESTSGELSRVAWTALGGYGALKARFDEDRSIIEANVELGRVSHYAVERIGRIGVFWNRAKHVIVYERTTQRAPRYEPSGDPANPNLEEQNPLKFLPIVRKIDEYVEILEPERRFAPAGQPAQATGFVQGLKFADRIIRVSSLWGVDVGNVDVGEVGWSVPLWRRDQDPALFPKPLVNLIAASEDAGEEALHAIADPERLVFFTNTERGANADTDRWPAVEGVDFVDAVARVEGTEAAFGDRTAETLRRPLASPAEAHAALAACTWRIEDGERPIDLIAGRGQQPISAKLRNLTVMRKPAALVAEATPTKRARALFAEFDDLRRDVRDTVRDGLLAKWPDARWNAEKARLQKRIAALRTALDADIEGLFRSSPCELLTAQAMRPLRALSLDVNRRIDEESMRVQREALALQGLAEDGILRLSDEFTQRIDTLAASGDRAKAQIDETLLRIRSDLDQFRAQAVAAVEHANAELQALLVDIGSEFDLSIHRLRIAGAQQAVSTARQRLLPALDDLQRACARFAARWDGKKEARTLADRLQELIRQTREASEEALSQADDVLHAAAQALTAVEADLRDAINATSGHLKTASQHVVNAIFAVRQLLEDGVGQFEALSGEAFAAFSTAIETLRKAIVTARGELTKAIDAPTFVAAVDVAKSELKLAVDDIYDQAQKKLATFIEKEICDFLPAVDTTRIEALRQLLKDVENLVTAMGQDVLAAAQKIFDDAWPNLSRALDEASGWVNHVADSLGESVRTAINAPLSLLRAFGAAPNLPELSFNREWLEYVFDPFDMTIDISPVTSFFAELGDDLKGLSLNLPSIGLDASGLLPAALRDFDLNAVFGSLGGVKMPGLLSRVKLPDLDRNAVKVTHGFDKKTKRAWVQADVDVPYRTNPVLFDAMSLALRLVKPTFSARSRMEAGLEGKPAFYAKGEIASTIRLEFSGNPLVDLRDASIRFDDRGQFDFDFSPDRIDFKAGLKFLADLIRKRSDIDQNPEQARGFVPALIEADGLPIGVRTTLELDPGPLNFGAFSIDGLALNLSFELVAKPEFKVATRLSLASPDKPFMLSVGVLGGGGWLAVAASYLPSKGLVESEVDIALAAGRVFSVNFGPIRGMAQVVFGVNAKFVSRGSRSRFSLIVFFLFSGNFRLWGIITVGLYLRLEIEYQSSGSLVGRGVVHITVKIGRFFKRTVRQRVNYRFAGKSNDQQALAGGTARAALPDAPAAAVLQSVDHGARAAAYLARYED